MGAIKIRFLSSFLWLMCFNALAQSVQVSGVVRDSIGNPLELASVIAKDSETKNVETYAITDTKGNYRVMLKKNKAYSIEVSYLSYQPFIFDVQTGNKTEIHKDIKLRPDAQQLEEVEITYTMPITNRGDTLVYNTDAFTTGKERKLEDVVKALPGIEVNENGEIEVDGKAVEKVMIEGKDFFDGDSKLANKNIPADVIDKVEVLRNYNEIDQLRGITNTQDQTAINLKLKEGKTNFWFGEVTAGAGYGEKIRYVANPRLFYYSPEYSMNIITSFNNTGDVPFTFRDYFNFTGGFKNFNQDGGTRFNISDSGLAFAVMQNNRTNEIENDFVAGNFSYNASESLDLSGFAIFSDNRTDFMTQAIKNYIATGETEENSNTSHQHNRLAMLKLSSVYKPNRRFQTDYDALFKLSKQTETSDELSLFGDVSNTIIQRKENTPFSVNQNLNAYYTLNEKNIFAGKLQHLWQDEDPFYNAVVAIFPFSELLGADNEQNNYDINQDKRVKTSKLDTKVDYYHIINNKSHLNLTLGTTQSRQQFNSSIFQRLDNASRLEFTNTPEIEGQTFPIGNDVVYRFSDVFLGLKYKFMTGIFTFTPGATLHRYDLNTKQLETETSQGNWAVLPHFFVVAQFRKSESIRFRYTMTAEYTDINNYAEGFVFNNYNTVFRGNRFLENALANTFSLSYINFNMFNHLNIQSHLNYTRRINTVKNNTEIVAINQVMHPENIGSNFADETVSFSANLSKRIKKVQYNLSGNIGWNGYNSIINGQVTGSESFTQNYRGSIQSNFKEFPNFEIGYNRIVNQYDNGGIKATFYTDSPFANLEIYFLKHFIATADWNYYNYTNKDKTVKNEYSFLKANLYYQKEGSKWEYSVEATNLLDVQAINQDNFDENFNTTSSYHVMPRMVVFSIKYDL